MATALEKQSGVARGFRVALFGGESGDTRTLAALDVILQTGARMAAREVHAAAGDHKSLVNEMQNAAGQTSREERPEVERAVLLDPAGEVHPGESLRGGELNVRVCFVVAQQNVEFGMVSLDEVVFERQRFA